MLMYKQIFTIGHSNLDSNQLINHLKQHDIDAIIDVRSKPYSKYTPQFNKEAFGHICKNNQIKYYYLGDLLGGKPDDPSVIINSNKIDYNLLSQKDYFIRGIHKLLSIIKNHNTCIMCSEGHPNKCHRNLLISPILEKHNINVFHILPNGEAVTSDQFQLQKNDNQLVLF